MKFLKNNKGVTGIDIVMSILIIIVSVTLISIMYSNYIEKSKEVKRNTAATNIAMKVIEEIENTEYDDITNTLIENNFGITAEAGYTIRVKKIDEIEELAIKFNVEVEYKISNKSKTIELSTTKTKGSFQANIPDMNHEEVKKITKTITVSDSEGEITTGEYNRYILKYSNIKKGYIEAKTTDDDWYSISAKKFAVIAYAPKTVFNTNGVIDLKKCAEIYVWAPKLELEEYDNIYRFLYETTYYPIKYTKMGNLMDESSDKTYSIQGYMVDTTIELPQNIWFHSDLVTGRWVKVNSNLNPIDDNGDEITDENNILNILKTKEFTWE